MPNNAIIERLRSRQIRRVDGNGRTDLRKRRYRGAADHGNMEPSTSLITRLSDYLPYSFRSCLNLQQRNWHDMFFQNDDQDKSITTSQGAKMQWGKKLTKALP